MCHASSLLLFLFFLVLAFFRVITGHSSVLNFFSSYYFFISGSLLYIVLCIPDIGSGLAGCDGLYWPVHTASATPSFSRVLGTWSGLLSTRNRAVGPMLRVINELQRQRVSWKAKQPESTPSAHWSMGCLKPVGYWLCRATCKVSS